MRPISTSRSCRPKPISPAPKPIRCSRDATLKRGQSLITTYAISQQDLDQRAADASNKQGLVRAAQANLDRLRVLEQYKRIVAPFDGLVTARTTDVGALINAGSGGGPPMFVVSETQQAARLCQRSAELRAQHPGRHQGANRGARISGQDVPGNGREIRAVGRHRVQRHAHTARRRQFSRRTDDRRLHQCEFRAAASGNGDQCAGERADFQSKRPACRDRRQRRAHRAPASHDRRAIWATRSKSDPESSRTTAW